jgi:hypothetical protein
MTLTPPAAAWGEGEDIPEKTDVRTFHDRKRRYLLMRHRPKLPTEAKVTRRHWIFVYETSSNRNPLLGRAQIELMEGILHHAAAGDTFQVVTAAHRAKLLTPKPLVAQKQTATTVGQALGKTHLLGALDLEAALKLATKVAEGHRNACIVYLGSGQPVLGERSRWKLLDTLNPRTRFIGVAVGKRYNGEFFALAARRTNGLHVQVNPDENLRWRAMEMLDTLNTPRITGLKAFAEVDGKRTQLLLVDTIVSHGEQACAVLGVPESLSLPRKVTLTGVLHGREWHKEIDTAEPVGNAGFLPRTWAKLEIGRLEGLYARTGDKKVRDTITQLSLETYVMCRWTSLIVLENQRMYRDYGVEQGRSDHWAMYPAPAAMEVVYEPVETPTPRSLSARKLSKSVTADLWRRKLLGSIRTHELLSGEMLLANARELLADGQFTRGRDLLAEVLELDATNVEARELHRWLSTALELSGQVGTPRPIVPGMGNQPWYELIRYPSSFPQLQERKRIESVGSFAEPAADRTQRKKLKMRIRKVGFQDIPLEHVITFLRDVTGANIAVQWKYLKDQGLDRDTEISLDELRNVTDRKSVV